MMVQENSQAIYAKNGLKKAEQKNDI